MNNLDNFKNSINCVLHNEYYTAMRKNSYSHMDQSYRGIVLNKQNPI